ncbi:hypothetical protein UQ52_00110 [Rickettsia conorii subsp. raoultii]|uniref:Uncharacterized protein n=1 Tax=Rickettsia conorii subsp. raoultii TaxID=369822 RepID=A0A9N7BQN3_RICCR|nr:hypothetical protein UQ52_00110 [Rickettsia conorii subsp. raoultii]APZ29563.1 hypothetical protein RRIM16_00135 [Rickettsia conorii subsp. raoultii]
MLSSISRKIVYYPGVYDFGFYSYLSDIGANGYAMSELQIIERNETNFDSFIYRVRSYIYNNLIEKIKGILQLQYYLAR